MTHFLATVQTLGFALTDTASTRAGDRSERGSVTIENVVWAVAVIVIAAIVVAAITAYVTTKAGEIQ